MLCASRCRRLIQQYFRIIPFICADSSPASLDSLHMAVEVYVSSRVDSGIH